MLILVMTPNFKSLSIFFVYTIIITKFVYTFKKTLNFIIMRVKMTKKLKTEFFNIVEKHGYYSEEVKKFNANLEYTLMHRLNNLINRKTNKPH